MRRYPASAERENLSRRRVRLGDRGITLRHRTGTSVAGLRVDRNGGFDGCLGGLFDLVDGDNAGGLKMDHDTNTMRNTALAAAPVPDVPHTDVEEAGEVPLLEVEPVERCTKLSCGRHGIPPADFLLPNGLAYTGRLGAATGGDSKNRPQ
jgi:hypothetical protein